MSAASKHGVLLAVVLFFAISTACSRAPQSQKTATPSATAENYPSLTAGTKEITDAFTNKNYQKVLELTYPKVIEAGGGREKMMATMQKEIKGMESAGVALLSTTPGSPTNFVPDAGSIYAVIPITLKMKAQDGVFQTEGTLIAISSDGGATWTFIDAAGKDDPDLKVLSPNVLDKLKLPPDKPPVKIG